MNDLIVSLIRTVVPAIVGLVIGGLANIGIDIDNEALTNVLMGAFIGAYYLAARWLEGVWPAAGWLLGFPKQPTYS